MPRRNKKQTIVVVDEATVRRRRLLFLVLVCVFMNTLNTSALSLLLNSLFIINMENIQNREDLIFRRRNLQRRLLDVQEMTNEGPDLVFREFVRLSGRPLI